MNSASLYGTLTDGSRSISAAYSEIGFVRLENGTDSWIVEESEWRTRRRILLSEGWWAA
jgi:hypothetical protein